MKKFKNTESAQLWPANGYARFDVLVPCVCVFVRNYTKRHRQRVCLQELREDRKMSVLVLYMDR